MTRSGFRSMAAALMAAALLGVVGAPTPSARADPNDDKFIGALQSQGVTFQSPEAAIGAAHEVCRRLDQGESETQVSQDVINETDLDPYHAGYFVGASVGAYCPQFAAQG
jgi:hypothetical protein